MKIVVTGRNFATKDTTAMDMLLNAGHEVKVGTSPVLLSMFSNMSPVQTPRCMLLKISFSLHTQIPSPGKTSLP